MITIILALLFAMVAVGASAQETNTVNSELSYTYVKTTEAPTLVYRSGEHYIVGNQLMNKRAYAGYLANTSPAAFARFRNGYIVSSVGWGLLAGGLGLEIGANTALAINGYHTNMKHCHPGDVCFAPHILSNLGHAAVIASIPTLIIGYWRMHDSVGIHNQEKSQAYWSVTTDGTSVGLAYNF